MIEKAVKYYHLDKNDVRSISKEKTVSKARALIYFIVVRKMKISCADVAKTLNIAPSTVSKAVLRGKNESDREILIKNIIK